MSDKKKSTQNPPKDVQILSMILFTGFAIPVSIVAINFFWPAGILLAAYFAHQWGKIARVNGPISVDEDEEAVRPHTSEASLPSSGNATFDAYRAELLSRLEQEQQNFESFLGRLREARDKSEFEQYMEDRAEAARIANA